MKIFIGWLGLLTIGFINGALREILISRFLRKTSAHQFSALTGVVLFSMFIYLVWNWLSIETESQAWGTGAIWFILTFLTEALVINRFMGKMSWNQILETYNLMRGELWPLVLIWIGLFPILMFYYEHSKIR